MAPRSAVPSRNSAKEAAIQLLSAVLGSVAAALAVLALDGVDAVVLVTVVLLVVVVLGVAVAGLGTGSVADPTPGRPTVGPAPPAGSPAPPGTSRPSASPADAVAPSGSITTCGAMAPEASTTPPAPKAPPIGVTNRADISDPPMHATPPSAPSASSREASTESPRPVGPTRFDRAAKKAIRESGRVAGNAYR